MMDEQSEASSGNPESSPPDDPGASITSASFRTAPPTLLPVASQTLSLWRVGPRAETVRSAPRAVDGGHASATFPVFELGSFVARGGCGEVWEARQTSLDRVVAVKRVAGDLREHVRDDGTERRRIEGEFRVEAIITGRLDHPNIVPVYDLGVDADGWPLMAMKLVKGDRWQDVINRDMLELAVPELLAKHLPVFIAMMQAVAFAHAHGIVHRDLKPSQVMVGEFGEVLLMDWGLAIAAGNPTPDAGASLEMARHLPTPLTASSPGGTPYFMAPEQTKETAADITFATDVYLLGGTLYHLLSGAYPHQASSSAGAMAMAALGKVLPFDRVAPDREIPAELAALALQAMAPDPADRVPSVPAFIERVRSYLSGASRRSESERLADEAEARHASVAARDPLLDTEAKYGIFADCLNLLRRAETLWPSDGRARALYQRIVVEYASHAIEGGDLTLANSLVADVESTHEREALVRRAEARLAALRRAARQRRLAVVLVVVLGGLHVVGSFLYIRGQRHAAARIASERDTATAARVREESARLQAEASHHEALRQQGIAEAARRSAEAEQYFANISVAGDSLDDGRVEKAREILMTKTPPEFHQWEWGHLLARLFPDDMTLPGMGVTPTAFSPDGARMYMGDREGAVSVWNPATGERIAAHNTNLGRVWGLAVGADGERLLTGSFDKTASIVDARSGDVLHVLRGHTEILRGVALSVDGTRALTTSQDKTARIWDTQTGQLLLTLPDFKNTVYGGEFTRDGKAVLTAARDNTVRLWDARTGALLEDYAGATEAVLAASFSPDGTRILSASRDFKARIHDARTAELLVVLDNATAPLNDACFSADGRMVATADEDGVARLWDAESGGKIADIVSDGPMLKIDFSPDAKHLVTASSHWVRFWNLGRIMAEPAMTAASPASPQWEAPVDRVRAFGLAKGRDPSWHDRERFWNNAEGRTLVRVQGRTFAVDSRFAAFSPDAKLRVDIDPATEFAVVRHASSGATVHELPRVRAYKTLFSPDGSRLAFVEPIDRITIFDTATWKSLGVLQMDPARKITVAIELYIAASAAWSPDGARLVVPYLNDHIVMWDTATMEPEYETPKTIGMGPTVEFSADGTAFAVAGNDDRITVWNAATGAHRFDLVGHTRPVLGASFSPDGQRIVSYSRDSSVKLWDANTGREILTLLTVEGILGHENEGDSAADTLVAAHFTRDGRSVFYATASGGFGVLDSFPWRVEDYPGAGAISLGDRIEYWKRLRRLGPGAAMPASP